MKTILTTLSLLIMLSVAGQKRADSISFHDNGSFIQVDPIDIRIMKSSTDRGYRMYVGGSWFNVWLIGGKLFARYPYHITMSTKKHFIQITNTKDKWSKTFLYIQPEFHLTNLQSN